MTPLYRKAIQSIESSGGNYSLLGPVTKNGDRAYGAYQVMGNNIPEWTERHLGQRLTPDQFLADRDAQDKVFDAQFGSYVDKYGNPQDAASAWFTGGPRSTGANKRDVLGTTGSVYVDKFNKYINGGASEDDPTRALSFAPTERKSMPALSADSVMGPGILNMGAGAEGGADVIGRGLTGMGAALAGISSPEQGKALTALQASMMKAPGNKWSVAHVDPKTGQALLTNGQSFVPWNAFTPKPDEDEYTKNFKKEDAKNIVDLGTNLSNAAADAVNQQTTVGELRKAFSNPNVQQGILGPYRQQMDKLYTWFGFGDPSKVADGDMANALSNKLALQLVNNGGTKLLPGSFSDSDRKFVTQMATSLSNDPAANMRLLDIYERSNNRVLEAEGLRQRVADANGGVLPPSFRTELGSLRKKWAEEDKARESEAPASTTPAKTDKPNTFKTKSGVTWSY